MNDQPSHDLIDRFVAHVAPAVEGRDLTDRALDALLSLTGGESAALFVPVHQRLRLVASRGEHERLEPVAAEAWRHHADSLRQGRPHLAPNTAPGADEGYAVVPILDGRQVQALVCVGGAGLDAEHPASLQRLLRGVPLLGRILFGAPGANPIAPFDAAAGFELARTPA